MPLGVVLGRCAAGALAAAGEPAFGAFLGLDAEGGVMTAGVLLVTGGRVATTASSRRVAYQRSSKQHAPANKVKTATSLETPSTISSPISQLAHAKAS